MPEEQATEQRNFSGDSARHTETQTKRNASTQTVPETPTTGLGFEQILPLYLQLTKKTFEQLTAQDLELLTQLVTNPHSLLTQHLTLPPPAPAPPAPAPNPLGQISSEEQALLDAYQQPQASVPLQPQPPENLQLLTGEHSFYTSSSASSHPFAHLSAEEQALLEAYQNPLPQPPLPSSGAPQFQISPEEQALLDAYSLPQPSNPFGQLTAEERAILGESPQQGTDEAPSEDLTSSSVTTTVSASERDTMEPADQDRGFRPGSSSFYSSEPHLAYRFSQRASASGRSSGVRSSFAEEQIQEDQRLVRPSMDIAGGHYTRPGTVQQAKPTPDMTIPERMSRGSEGSSQMVTQDLPSEFPRTFLPPTAPPPPPHEPPTSMLNFALVNGEGDRPTFDTGLGQHSRMDRLNLIRSSFAAERRSVDKENTPRGSGMFADVPDTGKINISTETLATELQRRYQQLAVVPDDVPFPLSLLCMLWGFMQPIPMHDAEAAAWVMEGKKVIRVATLEDGTLWCMMNTEHADRLKQETRDQLPEMHSRVINLYRQGFQDLALVPDDHYFMQNVAYHLTGAGRLSELAALLRDAIWLETKLRSYGTGAVVADFRRYFSCKEDPDLTLMLRAFQISANGSLDHSTLYILKEQMLGRLMISAQQNPGIQEWCEQGSREWRMAVPYRKSRSMPVHLLPKTPSLEQAGGLQRLILKGHTENIIKVELSPNGLEVVTASADGSIRVWDMEIGDFVLKMEDHEGAVTCFALSDDGHVLVSGGEDCMAIVYDLPSGMWRHKLCGHTKRINAVAVDPQCRRAVTSSQDMTTRIWSLAQGTCLHVLSAVSGARGRTWEEWAGHHDMAISPDARVVATVDADFKVRIWMMESANLIDTLEGHSDWIVSLSFAGDSGILLSASHDKTLRLWDLWQGVCAHVFTGHRGRINNLKVTQDGRRAVSVSDDAIGIVWDVKERSKVCELVGHGAWINDAAITKDGSRVVTVAGDELGIVWDGNTGSALRILKGHFGEINGISLSYKGRFAITASTDTTARVWDLSAPATHLEDFHHGKVTKILHHPTNRKVRRRLRCEV